MVSPVWTVVARSGGGADHGVSNGLFDPQLVLVEIQSVAVGELDEGLGGGHEPHGRDRLVSRSIRTEEPGTLERRDERGCVVVSVTLPGLPEDGGIVVRRGGWPT